jgi:hypothetical protein
MALKPQTLCNFHSQEDGEFNARNFSLCPLTAHLLRSLPLCDCVFGSAYFSRLPVDGNIGAHSGPTNIKLRLQLPLLLPVETTFSLTVGGVSRAYEERRPLLFDDSYVHSVSSSSSSGSSGSSSRADDDTLNIRVSDRVVLVVDLWHTALNPSHIRLLRTGFAKSAASHPFHSPCSSAGITPPDPPPPLAGDGHSTDDRYYLIKLLLVGPCGVGKSCFILRLFTSAHSRNNVS